MKNHRRVAAHSALGVLATCFCLALLTARACGLIQLNWWGVGGIVLGTLVIASLVNRPRIPTAEDVNKASAKVSDGEQYVERCLRYRLPAGWLTLREKTGARVKHIAPGLGLSIVVDVGFVHPDEDSSPGGVQRYAEEYVKEKLGGKMCRNDIRDLCGYPCVDFDYVAQGGARLRRITFVVHRSEYYMLFSAPNESLYQQLQPLIETILRTCEVVLPQLPLQRALGGRVLIGIPKGWLRIQDDDIASVWRGDPGPTELSLHFVQRDARTRLDTGVFLGLPDHRSHGALKTQEYDIPETGVRVLTGIPQEGGDNWALHAVQLPSGLVVVVEVDHQGRERDLFEGFLTRTAFVTEVLATIQDGRIE